jgi:hypothetical protein
VFTVPGVKINEKIKRVRKIGPLKISLDKLYIKIWNIFSSVLIAFFINFAYIAYMGAMNGVPIFLTRLLFLFFFLLSFFFFSVKVDLRIQAYNRESVASHYTATRSK